LKESTEATVKVCRSCGREYTGTNLTECTYCMTPLSELHNPKSGPQAVLVDFGFKTEIFRRFDNMEHLIKDQRTTIAVKDSKLAAKDELLASVLEKNQAIRRAFNLLKKESVEKIQSDFHNRPAEKKFGLEVLAKFLEVYDQWDEEASPSGVWWKTVADCFPGRERSVIRRLNELAKKHSAQCYLNKEPACAQEIYGFRSVEPPLKWVVGGYYMVNPKYGETQEKEAATA